MNYRVIIVALCAVVLALGATGCQRAIERTMEETTGIRVDENEERITITGDDGEEFTMEGSDASLPDDWPSDVPLYPDAELESSTALRMSDTVQLTASWSTSDDVNDVYDWYRSELPAEGWEIAGDFSMEQNGQRTANITTSKGDSEANVFIGDQSDGATGITINLRLE